jgi:hypothetical protein
MKPTIDPSWAFARFREFVRSLPGDRALTRADLVVPETLLAADGRLEVYYAPLDVLPNAAARVVLVGITPGWSQMCTAYTEARGRALTGETDEELVRAIKGKASFSGKMRAPLVEMLDGIGVGTALGVGSSAALFGDRRLHTTSAVRFPAFVDGKNYGGSSPKLLKSPLLRAFVEQTLAAELGAAPDALVVPLGRTAEAAVGHLAARGAVEARRCLLGFPHPSPANGHRAPQYAANRAEMARRVAGWLGAGG